MNQRFTENQLRALDISRDRDTVVSASAGTGKTTVMVERIFRLINQRRICADRLLVVTFTKLAAAEMREKLKDRLLSGLDDAFLAEQANKLDLCSIGTLHSFCAELLRNYFYILGIDPNFSIAEESVAAQLKLKAFENAAAEKIDASDETFLRIIEMLGKKSEQTTFRETVFRLYDFFICRPDFDEWFEAKKKNYTEATSESNIFLTTLNDELVKGASALEKAFNETAREANALGLVLTAEYAQFAAEASRTSGSGYVRNLARLKDARIPVFSKKIKEECGAFPELRFKLEKNIGRFKAFVSKQAENFGDADVETLLDRNKANLVYVEKLARFVSDLDREFFRLKQEKNLLDYNDLEHLTLGLLKLPVVKEELKEKYAMIFVDEYQDVNGVQNAIVESLRGTGNLFVVGDVKQSIYGFRQCDPRIFAGRTDELMASACGEVVFMNDNFRSHTAILNFVNSVFADIMTRDFGKIDYAETGMFRGEVGECIEGVCPVTVDCLRKVGKKEKNDTLDFSTSDACAAEDGYIEAQGELAAKHIREIVGSVTKGGKVIGYQDIVVLMRGMTRKAEIIYERLLKNGIPASVSFKNDSPRKEIKDIINFLSALDNPFNDIAYTGALLSYFGGLTAGELAVLAEKTAAGSMSERVEEYCARFKDEICAKLSRFDGFFRKYEFLSKCLTAGKLIAELAFTTGFDLFVLGLPNGGLRLKRLNRLIARAEKSDVMLCEFMQIYQNGGFGKENREVSAGGSVRIMSMHASKGLEFPAVILPCLETSFVYDYPAVSISDELGIALENYDFGSKKIFPDIAHAANGALNRKKQTEEELRLLYVAMTRAKNHLFIMGAGEEYLYRNEAFRPECAANAFSWVMHSLTEKYGPFAATKGSIKKDGINVNIIDLSEQNFETEHHVIKKSGVLPETEIKLDFVYPYAESTRLATKVTSSGLDRFDSGADGGEFAAGNGVLNLEERCGVGRTELGTAYHLLLEKADFERCENSHIERILAECVANGEISEKAAAEIIPEKISGCLKNPRFKKLTQGRKIFHELPFLSAATFRELGLSQSGEEVILQGVLDMLAVGEDNAIVIDFKFTKRSDKIVENYALQLNSYRVAAEKILKLPVEAYVLSIDDNKLIKFV